MDEPRQAFLFDLLPEARLPLLTPAEIYAMAGERLLRVLREDKRIERKPPGIHAPVLAEYFSMWANTPPDGGIVVVGVENDGRITGCSKLRQNRINDIEASGRNFCPDAKYQTKRIPARREDGAEDFLIVFLVNYNESRVVKTVAGQAFRRFGEAKSRLRSEELHELEIEKGQTDFELEPSEMKFPDHFDLDAIAQFAPASKGPQDGANIAT